MAVADLLLLAWVSLLAVQGFVRGFAAQAISLVGIAVGGVAGGWLAPKLVGDDSPWVALVTLAGAFVGALVLGVGAGRFGERARHRLSAHSPLRVLDGAGGVVGGVALGLAFAWLAAVLFVYQPSLGLRRAVQDSAILPALLRSVPPETVLRALDRFDPLPLLPRLADDDLPPPDASVLGRRATRAAARSVVKVEGVSCGLGVQGSGWLVRPEIVATNAHVVSGQSSTRVLAPNGRTAAAVVTYVDRANDVALLRVDALGVSPLAVDASQRFPVHAAVLGYPRDGALTAAAATAGEPRSVLAPDAYGGRVRPRTVIPLRGRVEHGESGGPVVDRNGEVFAMVFGGERGGRGGYAVPVEFVTRGIAEARAGRGAATGPCVR